MKRLLNIFLAVVFVVSCAFGLTACANPDDGGDKKEGVLIKKEGGVYVIYDYVDDGKSTDVELNLGDVLKVKKITGEIKIKSGAFDGADNITKLIVPNTVVEIQEGAFRKMSNLRVLQVPFVGLNAKADAQFEQTDAIEGKAVNNQRTFAHFFGTEQYDGGSTLTNEFGTVYIPHTLTTVIVDATDVDYTVEGVKSGYAIPMGAFEGATTLQNVELKGANLKEIGVKAFKGCTALTKITIPTSIVKVYDYAFMDCINLEKPNIPADKQGLDIFKGCDK